MINLEGVSKGRVILYTVLFEQTKNEKQTNEVCHLILFFGTCSFVCSEFCCRCATYSRESQQQQAA